MNEITKKRPGLLPVIVYLVVCYAVLKTLNGSIWRLLPILDVPALVILGLGFWFLLRKGKTAAAG